MNNSLRIQYNNEGFSKKMFYTNHGMVFVKLDKENLKFTLINSSSNQVIREGTAGSLPVLMRKAKKELNLLMNKPMGKEERPARRGKAIGGLPRTEKKPKKKNWKNIEKYINYVNDNSDD